MRHGIPDNSSPTSINTRSMSISVTPRRPYNKSPTRKISRVGASMGDMLTENPKGKSKKNKKSEEQAKLQLGAQFFKKTTVLLNKEEPKRDNSNYKHITKDNFKDVLKKIHAERKAHSNPRDEFQEFKTFPNLKVQSKVDFFFKPYNWEQDFSKCMDFSTDDQQKQLYELRKKFLDKDVDENEREKIKIQMKECNNPWKTVIAAVVCPDEDRRAQLWDHVGRAIENQFDVAEKNKLQEAKRKKALKKNIYKKRRKQVLEVSEKGDILQTSPDLESFQSIDKKRKTTPTVEIQMFDPTSPNDIKTADAVAKSQSSKLNCVSEIEKSLLSTVMEQTPVVSQQLSHSFRLQKDVGTHIEINQRPFHNLGQKINVRQSSLMNLTQANKPLPKVMASSNNLLGMLSNQLQLQVKNKVEEKSVDKELEKIQQEKNKLLKKLAANIQGAVLEKKDEVGKAQKADLLLDSLKNRIGMSKKKNRQFSSLLPMPEKCKTLKKQDSIISPSKRKSQNHKTIGHSLKSLFRQSDKSLAVSKQKSQISLATSGKHQSGMSLNDEDINKTTSKDKSQIKEQDEEEKPEKIEIHNQNAIKVLARARKKQHDKEKKDLEEKERLREEQLEYEKKFRQQAVVYISSDDSDKGLTEDEKFTKREAMIKEKERLKKQAKERERKKKMQRFQKSSTRQISMMNTSRVTGSRRDLYGGSSKMRSSNQGLNCSRISNLDSIASARDSNDTSNYDSSPLGQKSTNKVMRQTSQKSLWAKANQMMAAKNKKVNDLQKAGTQRKYSANQIGAFSDFDSNSQKESVRSNTPSGQRSPIMSPNKPDSSPYLGTPSQFAPKQSQFSPQKGAQKEISSNNSLSNSDMTPKSNHQKQLELKKMPQSDTPSDSIQCCQKAPISSEMIDAIWQKYDYDGNGTLDFQETLNFVRDIIDENITAEAFQDVFEEFDTDNSGTIDKDEIAVFISKIEHMFYESPGKSTVVEHQAPVQNNESRQINLSSDSLESHSLSSSDGIQTNKQKSGSFKVNNKEIDVSPIMQDVSKKAQDKTRKSQTYTNSDNAFRRIGTIKEVEDDSLKESSEEVPSISVSQSLSCISELQTEQTKVTPQDTAYSQNRVNQVQEEGTPNAGSQTFGRKVGMATPKSLKEFPKMPFVQPSLPIDLSQVSPDKKNFGIISPEQTPQFVKGGPKTFPETENTSSGIKKLQFQAGKTVSFGDVNKPETTPSKNSESAGTTGNPSLDVKRRSGSLNRKNLVVKPKKSLTIAQKKNKQISPVYKGPYSKQKTIKKKERLDLSYHSDGLSSIKTPSSSSTSSLKSTDSKNLSSEDKIINLTSQQNSKEPSTQKNVVIGTCSELDNKSIDDEYTRMTKLKLLGKDSQPPSQMKSLGQIIKQFENSQEKTGYPVDGFGRSSFAKFKSIKKSNKIIFRANQRDQKLFKDMNSQNSANLQTISVQEDTIPLNTGRIINIEEEKSTISTVSNKRRPLISPRSSNLKSKIQPPQTASVPLFRNIQTSRPSRMIMREAFPTLEPDGNVKRTSLAPGGFSEARPKFQTLTQGSQSWDLSPRSTTFQNFQSQISKKTETNIKIKKALFPYDKRYKTIQIKPDKIANSWNIQQEDSIQSDAVNMNVDLAGMNSNEQKPVMSKRIGKTRVPMLNLKQTKIQTQHRWYPQQSIQDNSIENQSHFTLETGSIDFNQSTNKLDFQKTRNQLVTAKNSKEDLSKLDYFINSRVNAKSGFQPQLLSARSKISTNYNMSGKPLHQQSSNFQSRVSLVKLDKPLASARVSRDYLIPKGSFEAVTQSHEKIAQKNYLAQRQRNFQKGLMHETSNVLQRMMINTDSKKELQMMVEEQKNRKNLNRYFTANLSSSTDRTPISQSQKGQQIQGGFKDSIQRGSQDDNIRIN